MRADEQRVDLAQLEGLESHQAATRRRLQPIAVCTEHGVERRRAHVVHCRTLVGRVGERRRRLAVFRVGEPRGARAEAVDRLSQPTHGVAGDVVRAVELEEQREHGLESLLPRAQLVVAAAESRPQRARPFVVLVVSTAKQLTQHLATATTTTARLGSIAGIARHLCADNARARVAVWHHLFGNGVSERIEHAEDEHARVCHPLSRRDAWRRRFVGRLG